MYIYLAISLINCLLKVNLYRGYLAICHPEEQHLTLVEKFFETASSLCIREWKRLPNVVSHIHLTYLQAAQQVRSDLLCFLFFFLIARINVLYRPFRDLNALRTLCSTKIMRSEWFIQEWKKVGETLVNLRGGKWKEVVTRRQDRQDDRANIFWKFNHINGGEVSDWKGEQMRGLMKKEKEKFGKKW